MLFPGFQPLLGYSRSWNDSTNPKRVQGAFRRLQRMPKKDREALFSLLEEHGVLPRRKAA